MNRLARTAAGTITAMTLERMKIGIAAGWVFAALIIATLVNLSWTTGPILAILSLVPPVALFLMWREPTLTMSERIAAGRH